MSLFKKNKTESKTDPQEAAEAPESPAAPDAAGGAESAKAGDAAPQPLIAEDAKKDLRKYFAGLKDPVVLMAFIDRASPSPYAEYMVRLTAELAGLSPKISAPVYDLASEQAKKYDATFSPTLLVNPDRYAIRYEGAPLGEEARTLIENIIRVSMGQSGASETTRKILAELTEERDIKVFVNPGCPYCPGQASNAFKLAVEKPGLVRVACVDASQHTALANRYKVGSVPHTVINDAVNTLGLEPEERLAIQTALLKSAEEILKEQGGGHAHDLAALGAPEDYPVEEPDIVIVGAGPAGLTAAIYANRSGLSCVVLEKDVVGGQVTITPVVENYPGHASIPGKALMDVMSAHARQYADIREGEGVEEVKIGKSLEVYTNRAVYVCKAMILCTGATWKKIGAPGEDRFFGRGVSYCASCDGYAYKDKKVVVVGGGNTALTDALHLKNLGVDVTVVHRRDAFRAERRLQESLEREGIPVIWNSVVAEILGGERVTGVRLRNVADESETEIPVDGVFAAVGHAANVELAEQLGVTLTADGFIKVDRSMRTNIPRIYAAGDVTGGVRQIVTAVGDGSTAALSAFEDMANPYWKK